MASRVLLSTADFDRIIAAGHPAQHFAAVLVGGLLGLSLIIRDAREWDLSLGRRISLLTIVFFSGLMGAAVPEFVAGSLIQLQTQRCAINPKTIIAGLLFGFFAAAAYKKLFGIRTPTSDAFARGTCLMMAIGRLGCFAMHCCFGVVTSASWGVDLGDGRPRIPIQLVESALLFAVFALLSRLQQRRLFPDRRLFIFFCIYGVMRFVLEFWREPIAAMRVGLGHYQWLSLLLFGVGLFEILKRSRFAWSGREEALA